jgi:hypothetical protein
MMIFLLAQSVTDAKGWSEQIEKGGIVFVLVMVVIMAALAIHREWVYTRSYVKMLQANFATLEAVRAARYEELKNDCREMKTENRELQNLLGRSVRVTEAAVRQQ